MIKAVNLCKKFGAKEVLKNINFDIAKGEVFAFLGPNGAGKTTTVKILTGLIKPTSGEAFISGIDIIKNPVAAKRNIGYIPDQPFLYPKLKGYQYLNFLIDMFKLNPENYKNSIYELSAVFDMNENMNELIETYSQGMKQKLALIGAFFRKPEVIFMDEPMVGLDPRSAKALKTLVLDYSKNGISFFISTHTLELAEKLSTRIGIIKNGDILLIEEKDTLLKRRHENKNLEDIFLELTGGFEAAEYFREL